MMIVDVDSLFDFVCAASEKESKQAAPKKDVKEPRDVVSAAVFLQPTVQHHCNSYFVGSEYEDHMNLPHLRIPVLQVV